MPGNLQVVRCCCCRDSAGGVSVRCCGCRDGTVTTCEYQPPPRDSVTSFYPVQLHCVILATSVRSWPRDPSTPEGCSQAAPGHPRAQLMGTQPPQHWSPENPTLPELCCCAWRANRRWPIRVAEQDRCSAPPWAHISSPPWEALLERRGVSEASSSSLLSSSSSPSSSSILQKCSD